MYLKRLREIREKSAMSQREVANILEISLSTYAMNEVGLDTITLKNLVRFCDFFKVNIDYVLELCEDNIFLDYQEGFDKKLLATKLKEIRKNNAYTQEKIGQLLNIDHSVWCRYEQGKTTIPTVFLKAFCLKFQVSANEVLGKIKKPQKV